MNATNVMNLIPPRLWNHPDAAEFCQFMEDSVSMPESFPHNSLVKFFEGGSGYCWEADIPPRNEWERHAEEMERHIAEELA
jgi:hypothetical protein